MLIQDDQPAKDSELALLKREINTLAKQLQQEKVKVAELKDRFTQKRE